MFDRKTISNCFFEKATAEAYLEDDLVKAGLDDWSHFGSDWYDDSLEIYGVEDDVRFDGKLQQVIIDAGFSKLYLNHKDGSETHYAFKDKPIAAGWRKEKKE